MILAKRSLVQASNKSGQQLAGNNKDRMHTVSCCHFCCLLHWPGSAFHMWPHHITPCSMFYYNHNCFAFHLSRLQKVPSQVKILVTWTRPELMGANSNFSEAHAISRSMTGISRSMAAISRSLMGISRSLAAISRSTGFDIFRYIYIYVYI